MPYITTRDDVRLYTKVWGEGRPVILLHGWPLSADSWDDHAMLIADAGFKAIAYDRRGFGRSDQPWSGYEYDTLADDLAAVIDQTGAQDAALVGFSMGGGEVARYLSRHGSKKVSQAGLISSIVPYMLQTDSNPDGVPQSMFDDMTRQMMEDRSAFFASFFRDFYGMGMLSSPVSGEVIEWSRSVAMQASLKATLACAAAFATTDFRKELGAFTMPTLIVHGTADATVPIGPSARAAHRGISNATLVEIDGGPHGLLATHKEDVAGALLSFLNVG
jgi:non-heme chloroperoxidase